MWATRCTPSPRGECAPGTSAVRIYRRVWRRRVIQMPATGEGSRARTGERGPGAGRGEGAASVLRSALPGICKVLPIRQAGPTAQPSTCVTSWMLQSNGYVGDELYALDEWSDGGFAGSVPRFRM